MAARVFFPHNGGNGNDESPSSSVMSGWDVDENDGMTKETTFSPWTHGARLDSVENILMRLMRRGVVQINAFLRAKSPPNAQNKRQLLAMGRAMAGGFISVVVPRGNENPSIPLTPDAVHAVLSQIDAQQRDPAREDYVLERSVMLTLEQFAAHAGVPSDAVARSVVLSDSRSLHEAEWDFFTNPRCTLCQRAPTAAQRAEDEKLMTTCHACTRLAHRACFARMGSTTVTLNRTRQCLRCADCVAWIGARRGPVPRFCP